MPSYQSPQNHVGDILMPTDIEQMSIRRKNEQVEASYNSRKDLNEFIEVIIRMNIFKRWILASIYVW